MQHVIANPPAGSCPCRPRTWPTRPSPRALPSFKSGCSRHRESSSVRRRAGLPMLLRHDPQARPGRIPAGQLAADRGLEPGRAETARPGQVSRAAFQRHGHRSAPGSRPERFARGFQHRGPGAFQQVPDLVHLSRRVSSQLPPAGTRVPQPGPRCVRVLGLIAVQARSEPGDDDRVLGVGLIEGQVLALAGAVDQQSGGCTHTSARPRCSAS